MRGVDFFFRNTPKAGAGQNHCDGTRIKMPRPPSEGEGAWEGGGTSASAADMPDDSRWMRLASPTSAGTAMGTSATVRGNRPVRRRAAAWPAKNKIRRVHQVGRLRLEGGNGWGRNAKKEGGMITDVG